MKNEALVFSTQHGKQLSELIFTFLHFVTQQVDFITTCDTARVAIHAANL